MSVRISNRGNGNRFLLRNVVKIIANWTFYFITFQKTKGFFHSNALLHEANFIYDPDTNLVSNRHLGYVRNQPDKQKIQNRRLLFRELSYNSQLWTVGTCLYPSPEVGTRFCLSSMTEKAPTTLIGWRPLQDVTGVSYWWVGALQDVQDVGGRFVTGS